MAYTTSQVILYLTLFILAYFAYQASAIGCFVCSSVNNSTPGCEDTFNNSLKHNYYQPQCKSSRKGRQGIFPATECVKLKGTVYTTGDTYMVRTCVVDNGDINSDTEIGRSNHCGLVDIEFNDKTMSGCVLSCKSHDGCNKASGIKTPWIYMVSCITAVITVLKINSR